MPSGLSSCMGMQNRSTSMPRRIYIVKHQQPERPYRIFKNLIYSKLEISQTKAWWQWKKHFILFDGSQVVDRLKERAMLVNPKIAHPTQISLGNEVYLWQSGCVQTAGESDSEFEFSKCPNRICLCSDFQLLFAFFFNTFQLHSSNGTVHSSLAIGCCTQ